MIKNINNFLKLLEKKQKTQMLVLALLMLLSTLMEVMSIASIYPLLLYFTNQEMFFFNSYFSLLDAFSVNKLTLLSLIIFILFLLKSIFLMLILYFQSHVAYNMRYHFNNKLLKKYMNLEYRFHNNINSSILVRNLITENKNLIGVFNALLKIFYETITLFGIIAFLIYIQPFESLILVLVVSFVLFIFISLVYKKLKSAGLKRQYFEGMKLQISNQIFNLIKEIKLSHKQKYFEKKFSIFNKNSTNSERFSFVIQGLPAIIIELLGVTLLVAIILMYVLNEANSDTIIISLGIFIAVFSRILPLFSRIMSSLHVLRYQTPSIQILYDDLKIKEEVYINDKLLIKSNSKFDINIKDISFSYDNGKNIINNLNLILQSNKIYGIYGDSGSGKSTFINILSGLLKPSRGDIFIDNQSIYKNLKKWQVNISYVTQDFIIQDDSIKKNIAFGYEDSEIDESLVYECLKKVQLSDFVTNLTDKINTVIGENGKLLSGGQRQRLVLARALYTDPKIIIFDEATNQLPEKIEDEIFLKLTEIAKNKIIIIISHNRKIINKCNFKFYLNNGSFQNV